MSEQKRIGHGQENVFQLEKPDSYSCMLYHYHIGHSELIVSLGNEHKNFSYICFIAVEYVECPAHWLSANFTTAPQHECMGFMRQSMTQSVAENYIDDYRLYLINAPMMQIKILAAGANHVTNLAAYQQSKDENLLTRIITNPHSGKPCIIKKLNQATGKFDLLREFVEGYGFAEIELGMILDLLEQGYTQKEIMFQYSWISAEDIQACLIYARRAISKPSDTP